MLFLAAAVFLALQVVPAFVEQRLESESLAHGGTGIVSSTAVTGRSLALLLPSLSPFSAFSSAVAARSAGWVFVLSLPVLAIAFLKGRWFCFHICPTGFLAEYAGKLRPGSRSEFAVSPPVGGIIALFVLGGALAGYPLFLWLDPLSIFNGFFSAFHTPLTLVSMLPAIGLIIVIGLTVWRPNVWCYRLCPLGFSQELLGKAWRHMRARRKKTTPAFAESGHKSEPGLGRRLFLAICAGGIAGFCARMFSGKSYPIRPPGIVPEEKFTALCMRCGNCMRACPKKIIFPDVGQSGVAGLLTPVLKINPDYCAEWCNECTKVCPTGAIKRHSLEEKNCIAIGVARIEKENCLSWSKSQMCMVCDEFCPFHAIKTIKGGLVPCPEVLPDICRGCGVCQVNCPAEKRAIIVHGEQQRKLAPVKLQGGLVFNS